jgi:hypothetical protein
LFAISDKAIIEFGGAVSSGQVVRFDAGQGKIILDHSNEFSGLIEHGTNGTSLATGDQIDISDLSFVSGSMTATVNFSNATNISTVQFSNGTASVTLKFLGSDTHWSLVSDGHGGTTVADPPPSTGATIDNGATLDISYASAENVAFSNVSGTTGTLVLNDPSEFTGVITGFAGDGTLSNSDLIDLKGINFSALTDETYVENAAGTAGTLTLSDGTTTTNLTFSGNYVFDNFKFASDGSGGTLVIDPPVQTTSGLQAGTTASGSPASGSAATGLSAASSFNFVDKHAGHDSVGISNLKALDVLADPNAAHEAQSWLNLSPNRQIAPDPEVSSWLNDHFNSLHHQQSQAVSHDLL